ncbi:ABC-type lipoprotein export system, ATPase component [Tissierella praeacuta DSM 18095]|uniref:ABC-type lipoprotein export system, ATPase component n=1 Tax=Tissierella praeacuta DSM 18095 TaxID=1123404 RepID=A0A1M4TP24_9FIRM|nr:ATP-binding cassette domain-containing protein [Tissierella praeacuta]TCU77422.1 ABC-type lipoprotein export system ATPase subunit [Tissierella praeacuta]SHE46126.1 ABC-type lipoprotein export system, ATPase component [Tissierella praeacuta DSM 18095]SUP04452.1 Putative ABC transporter ATP-binding protein TM_0222 [Tissierella praeacuta]
MRNFIEIKKGKSKNKKDEIWIKLDFGRTYTVVGNTGSGKSQLIEDIASFSQGDSITQRIVSSKHPINLESAIAHLSQHMTFVADYSVKEFFEIRFQCQNKPAKYYKEVIKIANQLTGDGIKESNIMTKLSGGQTRALMIADIILNKEASIILIDEIENAGINKSKAIQMLQAKNKLVIIITHNPSLALLGEYRIVMRDGGMYQCLKRETDEIKVLKRLQSLEVRLEQITENIRKGKIIDESLLE